MTAMKKTREQREAELERWTRSEEGQSKIRHLFMEVCEMGGTLGPVGVTYGAMIEDILSQEYPE